MNFLPIDPSSSKVAVLTVMNMLKSRGTFDVIVSIGERVFLAVISEEIRKVPKAVVRQSDTEVGVLAFLLFKIPDGVAAFKFLVFTITDVNPSLADFDGNIVGQIPNLSLPKIVQFALRVLFAANHNLVAGNFIKMAL